MPQNSSMRSSLSEPTLESMGLRACRLSSRYHERIVAIRVR